jgi:hypothetical protein
MLSTLGSIFCVLSLGAFDQGLDVLLERVTCLGCLDDRLAGFQFGPGQLQHVGGLDIGHGAEHGQQFRHIDEAGEAGIPAVAAAIGRELQGGDGFGEAGCQASKCRVPVLSSSGGAR